MTRKTLLHHAALLTLLCSSLLGCEAQTSQSAAMKPSAPPPASKNRAFPLPDPALGMVAAAVHVPAGWGFAGTVVHANNCVVGGPSFQWNMESADGLTGIMVLPVLTATGNTNPQQAAQLRQQGCTVVTSTRAADFVRQVILPHMRPNARIVSVGEEPNFSPQVQQLRDQEAQLEHMMPPVRTQFIYSEPAVIESARVRIAYQRNGHDVEEFISALTKCQVTRLTAMGYATLDCSAPTIVLLHTPAGQLDAFLANALKTPPFTINQNPAWQQKMDQIQQAQNDVQQQQIVAQGQANMNNLNAQAARGQAMNDSINQRGAAIVQAGHNSQAAIDHAAQGTALSLNDQNVFQNSNGTDYTGLSNNYAHTYDNGQGTIIQTNSAYAPGGSALWTELTPKY